MPQFFKKDAEGYWGRYPEHLKDMDQILATSGLTPATLHVMGEPDDEAAPAALIFTTPPGGEIPRHAHKCERFEIILEGTLLVDDMELGPGDVMIARSGEAYGPHIAGAQGCRTLEVFSTLAGAHHQILETPEGPMDVEFGSLAALAESSAKAGQS
ncbi:MAG: cupin domain-containing protein [Novosphingobium sp.]|nr:cupin domain-containing protein [Novosphingobium sp.]